MRLKSQPTPQSSIPVCPQAVSAPRGTQFPFNDPTGFDFPVVKHPVLVLSASMYHKVRADYFGDSLAIAKAFGRTTWSESLDAYVAELEFNQFHRHGKDGALEWCEPNFLIVPTNAKVRAGQNRGRFTEIRSEKYLRRHVTTGGSRYIYDSDAGIWRCPSAEVVAFDEFGFSYHVVTDLKALSKIGRQS